MGTARDEVVLWTWDDGWKLVRPVTESAFLSLFGRLRTEAGVGHSGAAGEEYDDLAANKSGDGSSVFFLRPVTVPAGARVEGPVDAVAGMIFFKVDFDTGKLLPYVGPGLYQPLVVDLLRHIYDVLLGLDNVVEGVFTDREEDLFLPDFGTASGEEQLHNFVRDVALEVSGAQVSRWGWAPERGRAGWKPLQVSVARGARDKARLAASAEPVEESVKVFERGTITNVCPTHRDRHRPGKYWFEVTVPARRGEWAASDGEALDMRRHIPADFPYDEYWCRQTWQQALSVLAGPDWDGRREIFFPPDTPRLPFTVSTRNSWGEEPFVSTSLEEALVMAGVVARNPDEVRQVARRRSVVGRWHPDFEVPLLLGEVPTLLVAPLGQLPSLVDGGEGVTP